jgi:ParB/RepB/Spo0J family partition protein
MAPKFQRVSNTPAPATHVGAPSIAANGLFGVPASLPTIVALDVSVILDNPNQARKHFDAESIGILANSIKERGQLTPILVRPHEADELKYYLVAGERRLRAIKLLERKTIHAIVTMNNDPESLSLIENASRENLSPIEFADGLKSLIEHGGHTQEAVATIVGVSAVDVSEHLGILTLPDWMLDALRKSETRRFTRSALVELSRITDDKARDDVWARMLEGPVTVSEMRMARKESKKDGGARKDSTGAVLASLGRTINGFTKGVATLKANKGHLEKEHLERLLAVRTEIDELLAETDFGRPNNSKVANLDDSTLN